MICSECHKDKWFIRERSYFIAPIGKTITSTTKLCRSCAKKLKEINDKINEDFKTGNKGNN